MPEITEERIKEIIREELGNLMKSDRFTFEKLIQILDGRNIKLGTGTGTQLGTANTEKLGFWGTTPAGQPAAVADADGTLADVTNKFNTLLARSRTIGIIDT